jgi:hypothetical protein
MWAHLVLESNPAAERQVTGRGGWLTALVEVQKALDSDGIEFIGTPTDRPGIRLSRPL